MVHQNLTDQNAQKEQDIDNWKQNNESDSSSDHELTGRRPSTMSECEDQLDTLRRTISKIQYDTRDFNNVYLLSGELLIGYAERLQTDGSISRKEQIRLFNEIFKISTYIVEKVKQGSRTMPSLGFE